LFNRAPELQGEQGGQEPGDSEGGFLGQDVQVDRLGIVQWIQASEMAWTVAERMRAGQPFGSGRCRWVSALNVDILRVRLARCWR
jgi:hypothetical protein